MPMLLKFIKESMKDIRNTRKYSRSLKTTEMLAAPIMAGVKTITYKGTVQSESRAGKTHLVQIKFHNVKFFDEKEPKSEFGTYKGNTFYWKPPSVKESKVAIKCSCEDFRFMFEHQLYEAGSTIGKYRSYHRKTAPPPIRYPYKNPGERLGYCKHIHNFLRTLQSRGKIVR